MTNKVDYYKLMNDLFEAMQESHGGHEKELELMLINASNEKLIELANKYLQTNKAPRAGCFFYGRYKALEAAFLMIPNK